MSQVSPIPSTWKHAASKLRFWINMGWGWVYFSKMLVFTACFCALMIWLLRLQSVTLGPVWILGGGLLVVAGLWSGMLAAPRRVDVAGALSRLDVGWGLGQRLVSACQGVGEWPELPASRRLPLHPRWTQLLWPCLLSLLLLAAASWLPLPPPKVLPDASRAEPPAWTRMDALAESLEQQSLLDESGPENLRREIEELRAKDMQDWYDPSTLEATDRLRTRTAQDAERLLEAMQHTAALLQLAAQGRDQLTAPQQQAMQQFLEKMQAQMTEGGFKMNPQMMQQLQQVDLSQLQQMNVEQLQQLEQQLMQNAAGMQQALLAAGMMQGVGEEPGSGGISRGGGASALTLKDFETIAEPVVPMALDPGSLENAQMGDLLSLRETEHEDDREVAPNHAGAVSREGGAGEVVWDQDVLPDEEKVLKEFFK